MEQQPLPRPLHWVKEAFSRKFLLKDGDQVVGELTRNWFSSDVDAFLNQTRIRFDVRGFLVNRVAILQGDDSAQELGTIALGWGSRSATLTLASGEVYQWKRKDWLLREWSLVHDLPGTEEDPEVLHYTRLRELFTQEGDIVFSEASPQDEILLLTGLFLWIYFRQRRRRAGAAGVIAAS